LAGPENAAAPGEPELVIDTPGGRHRAVFDEQTPVSTSGPLVFFAQSFGDSKSSQPVARGRTSTTLEFVAPFRSEQQKVPRLRSSRDVRVLAR